MALSVRAEGLAAGLEGSWGRLELVEAREGAAGSVGRAERTEDEWAEAEGREAGATAGESWAACRGRVDSGERGGSWAAAAAVRQVLGAEAPAEAATAQAERSVGAAGR